MNIEALLGLGVDDEAKTRALADRLRGRDQAAQFFGMSTIEPLAQAAQSEQANVQQAAQRGGVLRSALQKREAQAERERAAQAATAEQSEQDRQSREFTALADRESREAIEAAKLAASAGKTSKPTAAQQTAKYRADAFNEALSSMETLYAGGAGYDPTGVEGFKDKIANKSDLTRWASSEEGQQWASAASTAREQLLRTATGAAAPEGEKSDYIVTLIPQPGESDDTVRFKFEQLKRFRQILAELGGDTEEEARANYESAVDTVRAMRSGEQDASDMDAKKARLAELRAKRDAANNG